jgi:deazaflavin-dependent oxidoreductase (nitroreductase family)
MPLTGTYVPSKTQWVRENVEEYESSNGTRGTELRGDPVVVVTSVGAKSGNLRKNPVMRVERDGTYVAIASKGGAPEHPEWYFNFLAHPEVDLQDRGEKHTYVARLVEGDERADWWEHAVATWPTYGEYQKKTDREIPVFLLERA